MAAKRKPPKTARKAAAPKRAARPKAKGKASAAGRRVPAAARRPAGKAQAARAGSTRGTKVAPVVASEPAREKKVAVVERGSERPGGLESIVHVPSSKATEVTAETGSRQAGANGIAVPAPSEQDKPPPGLPVPIASFTI